MRLSPTDQNKPFTPSDLESFKAEVQLMPAGELFRAAQKALDRFTYLGSRFQCDWQLGQHSRGRESFERWRELRRLSWAFCKSSQLYRIEIFEVPYDRSPSSKELQEYVVLTESFARVVNELEAEAKGASVSIPRDVWAKISGVAERATTRSKTTANICDDARVVETYFEAAYPAQSRADVVGKTSKPR